MVSLAIDPPPSSQREHPRRGLFILVSLAILAALGAGFWIGRATAPGARAAATASSTPSPSAPNAAEHANASAGESGSPAATASPSAASPGAASPAASGSPGAIETADPAATAHAGIRRLSLSLDGALEGAIAAALAKEDRALAEQLTQVVNRLLVWELNVARDGRRGDRLEVLWAPPPSAGMGLAAAGEPVVHALRYASSKLGGIVAAYRYEAKGARWPRYYRPDGSELELRLADPPVSDYEQISSLLRDGRRHKGVDFKTPVGSPVAAPFDGVIERRNWNFAGNGNCLDIRDSASGRHAIFLHLDVLPKEMKPGRRVRRGEVIAASGNSGRSFAPHLHYQLEDASGRVLDPFVTLKTERRSLAGGEKAAFDAARAKLDADLGG